MNSGQPIEQEAEGVIRSIFDDLGRFSVSFQRQQAARDLECDLVVEAKSAGIEFRVGLVLRKRITPQTAVSLFEKMQQHSGELISAVYAPRLSSRVIDIASEYGIGFVDQAGNCRLRSDTHCVLIERRGFKPKRPKPKGDSDPFSPKSSRVVRAMLDGPAHGWKVRELADHVDVGVAVGLVSKVKRALIEQGYAIEHQRLLYLRDPVGLLKNWAKKYAGPTEQVPLFFRGDAETAEQAVGQWCRDNNIQYALAGFSAAWRIAPEVRYHVANVYVDDRGFDRELLDKLGSYEGGKRADTGANLRLWRPYDRSVFAGSEPGDGTDTPVTSALQTYLDLKQQAGRGEDAAAAIYEEYFNRQLQEAAQTVKELQHDAI